MSTAMAIYGRACRGSHARSDTPAVTPGAVLSAPATAQAGSFRDLGGGVEAKPGPIRMVSVLLASVGARFFKRADCALTSSGESDEQGGDTHSVEPPEPELTAGAEAKPPKARDLSKKKKLMRKKEGPRSRRGGRPPQVHGRSRGVPGQRHGCDGHRLREGFVELLGDVFGRRTDSHSRSEILVH